MQSPVFLFPGQGSQFPGMAKYLYENFKIVKETFAEASDSIQLNMAKLLFDSTDAELALTANTQPAIVLASVSTLKVLREEFGIKPQAVAGHSVGEYSALVAAETLEFSVAMKAVRLRGEAMQNAVPLGEGGMIALLGCTDTQAVDLCQIVESKSGFLPLSPANFNCPGQIVLSGSSKAIQWLQKEFKPELHVSESDREAFPKRIKLIPLNVSAPFHCDLMKPAEEKMKVFIDSQVFSDAKVPLIQNFTAESETAAEKIKQNLIKQITGPVLWTQSILKLQNLGYKLCIECGAGKILAGLNKKIVGDNMECVGANSLEELKILAAGVIL